jgi:hypothetical protein
MPTVTGSNNQVLTSNGTGGTSWQTPSVAGLYSQTAIATVASISAERSLFNTAGSVGTLTLPANSLTPGTTYMLRTGGQFRNSGGNNNALTFRLKGAGVLLDTGQLTMQSITTFSAWNVQLTFTMASATTMVCNFNMFYSSASDARGFSSQATSVFSPTVANTLDFTAQWLTADANNTISANFAVITKLF